MFSQEFIMKLIHVTDPHLLAPGELLHSLDPLSRFNACIHSINERESDADIVVVTGDLADRGQLSAYRALQRELERLVLPYRLLIGNHDDRANFVSVFNDACIDEHGFVQGVLPTAAGRFLFLDTVQAGQSAGIYCRKRCQWLQRALADCAAEPVYLFMHHPPFDVSIPFLDRIGLDNKQAFVDVIDGHDNIRHLFFGHVHRPISGSWRGIPFSTLTSTNHQVVLNMKDIGPLNYWDEAPTYSVVLLHAEQTIVHTYPYMNTKPLPV